MKSSEIPVYFYLPPSTWPSADILSSGTAGMSGSFKSSDWMWNTHWHWTLQTYFWLRESGCSVHLVNAFPEAGIMVTCGVSADFRPGPNLFVVSIAGDESPAPYVQMHVVQNRMETRLVSDSHYVPFWPQPGLIERDAARGEIFDTLAYFGDDKNIATELRSEEWSRFLAGRGINWQVRNAQSSRNADFSDIDAVISVRSFQRAGYIRKPASKLINAWVAGVPSILGREIAFREQRLGPLDYIEIGSFDEACAAVDRLAASPELRRAMVVNGHRRAAEFSPANIVNRWKELLFDIAQRRAARWFARSAAGREAFFLRCLLEKKVRGAAHRTLRALGKEAYAI
jgi:hypothetical protein